MQILPNPTQKTPAHHVHENTAKSKTAQVETFSCKYFGGMVFHLYLHTEVQEPLGDKGHAFTFCLQTRARM